jgi:hypothetical protein
MTSKTTGKFWIVTSHVCHTYDMGTQKNVVKLGYWDTNPLFVSKYLCSFHLYDQHNKYSF